MTNSTSVNPTLIKMLLLLGLVVLYIVGFNFFIGQIAETNQKIKEQNQLIAALEQKAVSLSDASGNIANFSDGIIVSLPQSDSSLMGISQIKAGAASAGVVIDNISYGAKTQVGEDLHKLNFGVDISGNPTGFKNFLAYLENAAPLSTISSVRLVQQSTTAQMSLALSFYWSPLPTQLPALEKPILTLSEADLALITQLAGRTRPALGVSGDTGGTTPDLNRSNIFEITN